MKSTFWYYLNTKQNKQKRSQNDPIDDDADDDEDVNLKLNKQHLVDDYRLLRSKKKES